MLAISSILDLDTKEHRGRRLELDDIGKKVKKVTYAYPEYPGLNSICIGDVFTVESIKMGYLMCCYCYKKNAEFICGKCKHTSFCSKECQKKAWRIWHRNTCNSSKVLKPERRPIEKIVLVGSIGHKFILDTSVFPLESRYFEGWITYDEVVDIKPDTTVSDSHIQQLKEFVSG